MHLKAAKKHCDGEGKLVKRTSVQLTLRFGGDAAATSLSDKITKAEALFTMSLAVKAIPFAYADTASRTFPLMFPDSKIAESFSCGRSKVSYIVSDGLGPHFKIKVIDEVSWPDVYYTIQIDEPPKQEQRVQQLDISCSTFRKPNRKLSLNTCSLLTWVVPQPTVCLTVLKSIPDLPRNKFLCFFSDGPNTMKSAKTKLKEGVCQNL
ncbi:hypothetical protein HPB48_010416 [Haemaphysalis longicornis]|uniref:Uncharacterized protein n=1 Tax=Haemaphysalis longicornis TaxID=44386 RepID=A0A9J6G860_HAELO|nr:hypothetical protein HPB48_010416 [Haemaphysalis longicornis]